MSTQVPFLKPDLAATCRSGVMRAVLSAADDVAPTPTTVLLLGESGTGKEVLARYLHHCSPRAQRPYVAVNCAALPADLLESELFGHERGAFTGATERKLGRVEQAHGGTLVLDEISELPLALQGKLLRVLQERELDRVGGAKTVAVDVRVIATSNRDLRAMVQRGQFRTDLFYRLNVFPITLPPLRVRRDDLPALATALLHRLALASGRPPPALTEAVLGVLRRHDFPGNVRELSNLLEQALVRSRGGELTAEHIGLSLPDEAWAETGGGDFPQSLPLNLGQLERLAIAEALRRCGGNRTHAARLLGIGLRTLRTKLNERAELTERQSAVTGPARISQLRESA